jgi:hypothetical protein
MVDTWIMPCQGCPHFALPIPVGDGIFWDHSVAWASRPWISDHGQDARATGDAVGSTDKADQAAIGCNESEPGYVYQWQAVPRRRAAAVCVATLGTCNNEGAANAGNGVWAPPNCV